MLCGWFQGGIQLSFDNSARSQIVDADSHNVCSIEKPPSLPSCPQRLALSLSASGGKKTRLLWKTTTNTVGDVVEEESWNAVNEGSLRAVESTPNWQLYDIRSGLLTPE